jgi:hypothetical protein
VFGVLVGASAQIVELANAPVVGEDVKLTVPDGALAPVAAVSVTVAVHVDGLPASTEDGEQPTPVDVGSADGLLEFGPTNAFPTPSTATHSDVVAHETPVRPLAPSISPCVLHVGVAAVGSVVITAPPCAPLPPSPTATHNAVEAHETPVG